MTKYDIIIRNARTGKEEKVDEVHAPNQKRAKEIAFQAWFKQIDMTQEQLMVVRSKAR